MSRDSEKPQPNGPTEPSPPTLRHPAVARQHAAARQPSAAPPALSAAPDAVSLLKAIRRRWLLTSSLGILAAGAALAAVMALVPTKHMATAMLEISANQERLIGNSWGGSDSFTSVQKTMAKRFVSRDVLIKALGQDQVRELNIVRRFPNPFARVTWLEDELKVDIQDQNELMFVSLPGDDPDELCVLVNALSKSFLDIVQGKERKQREERVKKIKEIAAQVKEKLGEKIATLQALYKGQGAPGDRAWDLKHSALIARLGEAWRNLATAQFESEKLRAKLAIHQAAKKKVTVSDIPDSALQHDMDVELFIKPKMAQIVKLEQAISRMDLAGTPANNTTRREIVHTLLKLHADVGASRRGLKDDLLKKYQEKLDQEHAQMVEAVKLELAPHENHVKSMQEQVDQLVRETENIGGTTGRIELVKSEIANLERQHADIAKQVQVFEVEEQAAPRVTLAQDAVPQIKDPKKRIMLMGLAPLAAFALAACAVGYWEFRGRRVHSADEIALGLGVRVVGAVPASARRQFATPILAGQADDHNLVESIDAIRTTLLRSASQEATQVVMVTSAVGGEGKTTLSSNLAVSLARAGRRTLLVDCDLRRPALHQLFEQTLQPGFSEVVLGEVELPDAVRPTTVDENLWLLPAGQWDREVLQELARDSVGSIFGRLKEEFDFVVIDSHPVLPATDSLLIAQQVDAVILSVMRGVSQTPRVHSAHERLATLGIRVFGAVVNGMPSEVYSQRYQYRQPTAAAA